MVLIPIVAPHRMFDCFICGEIDSMRRTYLRQSPVPKHDILLVIIPAPRTTLDTPLHNDPMPSAFEIVESACETPVYSPPGDGLMTCNRVCLVQRS